MKVLAVSNPSRYEKFAPDLPVRRETEIVFLPREDDESEIIQAVRDADALFVSPVTPVTRTLIEQATKLKMIHSEGVGFDRIDLEAAREKGIYVCNNPGCNAPAVAELTVMLMSMLLHRTLWGYREVRAGRQGHAVFALMEDVPFDLSDCTVGLVGFGAIAKATAERLRAYGSTLYYYARHRQSPEVEQAYGASYLPLQELAARCDIVSLHVPANSESIHMIDADFLARMKPTAFLVNTARGALIDDQALCDALRRGTIAGAGLDAYSPEPVPSDHPLLELAKELPDKITFAPHQGGITQASFRTAQRMMWEDFAKITKGGRPDHIVNGL